MFTVETKVYNMEFHGCKQFEIIKDNTSVQFAVLPEYLEWATQVFRQVNPLERSHCATGRVTVRTDGDDPQQAIHYVDDILYGIEHLLTLAHQHHVFTGELSCYDASHKRLATKGFSGRIGEPLIGSLVWGHELKQFLDIAVPRLDTIPAFRWSLYMFNETTVLASPIAQMEIPSLWTVMEFAANTLAETSAKAELLSTDDVNALQRVVKLELLRLGISNADRRGEIYTQLGSLSRRPVLALVKELLSTHSFEDYLEEADKFYRLRNDVVHGRNIELKGVTDLGERLVRFMRLLQKLLFSMAGVYHMEGLFKSPITDKDLSAD